MKILNRYIFKEALLYWSICLLAFLGVLLTIRMLKLTSLIVSKGVELSQIGLVFVSIIPAFLEIALPLATLLAVMLAFARLSGDSELVVMRASGISLRQLVRPIFYFGVGAGLLSLIITLVVSPYGARLLADTLFAIARTKTTAGLTEGVFNKLGSLTLYAEKIDSQNNSMTNILIDDRRDRENRKIISAKTGYLYSNETTRSFSILLHDGAIHEQPVGRYVLTRFEKNTLSFDVQELQQADVQARGQSQRELTLAQLGTEEALQSALLLAQTTGQHNRQQIVDANPLQPELTPTELKRKINRLRLERARRFAMPYAAFILALLAMPLGVQPQRSQKTWGVGLSAVLGMLVFVFYFGLLSVAMALAESGRVEANLGLWIPNLLTTVVAVVAINKIGSEAWQSIAHALERVVKLLKPKHWLRRTA